MAMVMVRPTGYYWIQFNYKKWCAAVGQTTDQEMHWEPGSWDAISRTWQLIGSDEPWLDEQIDLVGSAIRRL